MKLKKLAQGQKGFTLIELMIVVGIIGILVAIAAPNFARYQSKARQSEAKIALSAVYAAEKSFYAEYSAYFGSMDAIGYAPEGQKRFYMVGWPAADTNTPTGYAGVNTTPYFDRTNFPSTWTTAPTPSLTQGATSGANAQNFTAAASGQIRQSVGSDFWTITDQKILANTTISL